MVAEVAFDGHVPEGIFHRVLDQAAAGEEARREVFGAGQVLGVVLEGVVDVAAVEGDGPRLQPAQAVIGHGLVVCAHVLVQQVPQVVVGVVHGIVIVLRQGGRLQPAQGVVFEFTLLEAGARRVVLDYLGEIVQHVVGVLGAPGVAPGRVRLLHAGDAVEAVAVEQAPAGMGVIAAVAVDDFVHDLLGGEAPARLGIQVDAVFHFGMGQHGRLGRRPQLGHDGAHLAPQGVVLVPGGAKRPGGPTRPVAGGERSEPPERIINRPWEA